MLTLTSIWILMIELLRIDLNDLDGIGETFRCNTKYRNKDVDHEQFREHVFDCEQSRKNTDRRIRNLASKVLSDYFVVGRIMIGRICSGVLSWILLDDQSFWKFDINLNEIERFLYFIFLDKRYLFNNWINNRIKLWS